MINESLVSHLLATAEKAGDIIMEYYDNSVAVERKEDNSPVTEADLAANHYIVEELKKLTPQIPIVSEEGEKDPACTEQRRFWLVDPLDGTKSFIRKTGEFTVNIGLVEDKKPVLGIVYIPAREETYFTAADGSAWYKPSRSTPAQSLKVRSRKETEGLVVIASLSHRTQETDDYIHSLNVSKIIPASSSLKFCMVAKGEADIYPRFGPTMEWDTAAADAVLRAAGGEVTFIDGTPFTYGKEAFRNPHFIARGHVL